MKKMFTSLAAMAAITAAAPASAATILNAGFETGDLSGWTSVGTVSAVSSVISPSTGNPVYSAYEGRSFAVLGAGTVSASSVLTQVFQLVAGETIAFATAFLGGDELPFNDQGGLGILNLTTFANTVLFSQSIASVGDNGATPWTVVLFTAPSTGSYLLNANVQNIGDGQAPSYLLLDAAIVPEPEGWALMIVGIALAGAAARRHRKRRHVA